MVDSSSSGLTTLDHYGFLEAGRWMLKEGLKSGITFELYGFEKARVVYAFVVDVEVKYVGVCSNSKTTLKDRMGRYKSWQGGGANERIAKRIRKRLAQDEIVKIFALKPESSCQYRGLIVDLVKGLENPLICELQPEWNIQG